MQWIKFKAHIAMWFMETSFPGGFIWKLAYNVWYVNAKKVETALTKESK